MSSFIIFHFLLDQLKHFGIIFGIILAVFAIVRNVLMIFFDIDTLGELARADDELIENRMTIKMPDTEIKPRGGRIIE